MCRNLVIKNVRSHCISIFTDFLGTSRQLRNITFFLFVNPFPDPIFPTTTQAIYCGLLLTS